MSDTNFQSGNFEFDEIAIADLKAFQIAIPTKLETVYEPFLSSQIPIAKRHYQTQGWISLNHKIITRFEKLTIHSALAKEVAPLSTLHRIVPGIPLSFDVNSHHPLPEELSSAAASTHRVSDSDYPHHTRFRALQPRFVKICPLSHSLLDSIEKMLAAKTTFIAQNYEHLKQQTFYKTHFGL